MDNEFHIKRGDTLPYLSATLRGNDGTAADLTNATVLFKMRKANATAVALSRACSIIDAVKGKVRFYWQAGDTDVVGKFQGEFEVTYVNGSIETFPNKDFVPVIIGGDIR